MLFRSLRKAPKTKSALSDLMAIHGLGAARWSARDATSLAKSGYYENVIAFRCIQMIADAAATVALRPHRAGMPDLTSPLKQRLACPNPDQSGRSMMEEVYGHLQIHGNAYIEIVGDIDDPHALYVLRPDQVSIELDRRGWPSAWLHKTGNSTRRIVRDAEGRAPIVHIKLFNPLNDQYGQSPLAVAGNAVDLHNAAMAWNKSLLDNAARPSGALVYRGGEGAPNLTAEQFDRLKAELSETYQGGHHAGRPMVLDGGLEWRPMSLSPAEMDFLQLKNGAARDIALAFGVPPMLLGIPGDNTYSNYQQAVLAFWRHTILPLVGKVASALTMSWGDDEVEIGFDIEEIEALVESRHHRLSVILSADVLTDAEKRNALGFPAKPAPSEE